MLPAPPGLSCRPFGRSRLKPRHVSTPSATVLREFKGIEHPGMHTPTATAADLSQAAQENQAVGISLKHGFAAVTTGHYVVNRTRILKTTPPCRASQQLASVSESSHFVSLRGLTPETLFGARSRLKAGG